MTVGTAYRKGTLNGHTFRDRQEMQATRNLSWRLRLTADTGSGFSMNSKVPRSKSVDASVPNMISLSARQTPVMMEATAADRVR